MIQIRRGIFETNSSSSHSISIKKNGGYYTTEEIKKDFFIYDNWDGELAFWNYDLEFGREFSVLTTFRDKVRYAIASYGYGADREKIKDIESILMEVVPGLKSITYEKSYYEGEDYNYGYIDHQSAGLLQHFLNKKKITLREFLLNKKYVVFIDGDEYCITEKLFDEGLLNKDDFEDYLFTETFDVEEFLSKMNDGE